MPPALSPLTHPALTGLQGVRHGFFTRKGGASEGIYTSLNTGLGSRDDKSAVHENRARIVQSLGGDALITVHQHHSALCIRTRIAWSPSAAPRADAIVTSTPGLIISAQAADCGPILFVDPQAGVIGAAHAGWKGARGGILEATIDAMEIEGAERGAIIAVLGPSISAKNYEVGPEFVARFLADTPDNATYFTPSTRDRHSMFDLPRYTVDRLGRAGVQASALNRCTYEEPDLFYSYRRSVHQSEPDYGRLLSAIMLTHDVSTHLRV